MAENYISNEGVRKNLVSKLMNNEEFRFKIFKGRVREQFSTDKLKGAEERITANYQAGIMYKFYIKLVMLENIILNFTRSELLET